MRLYYLFNEVIGLTVTLILFSENTYKVQAKRVMFELANSLKNLVVRGAKCPTVFKDLFKFKI